MQISATIQNLAFSPDPITIALGSTVTWTNLDGVAHTVTADDGSWGSSMLGQGGTYSHVFTSPGSYTYHCAIHPYMMGTVVVTP
jgi:plastocyanin